MPRSGSRVRVPSRALHKSEYHLYARVAQLVEHDLAKVGVAGSSPVSRSSQKVNIIIYARVAQLVEHDLAKVGVAGSSPVSRSS